MKLTKVKNWIFNGLATRHPVKLVVGLVLGTVVLSGTGLYFGPNQFQEERSPIAGGVTSNELTGNDFRIMEEQRAADHREDLRDMIQYWNQLKKDEATSSTMEVAPKFTDLDAVDNYLSSMTSASTSILRSRVRLEQIFLP